MLTKCYPTSQGCSCGFQIIKVWPLGVLKPYRTSSYDVPSLLTISIVSVISSILWKICGIKHKHKKSWFPQKRWGIAEEWSRAVALRARDARARAHIFLRDRATSARAFSHQLIHSGTKICNTIVPLAMHPISLYFVSSPNVGLGNWWCVGRQM